VSAVAPGRRQVGPARADVVGSLLRPAALRSAREAYARSELAAEALAQAEDRAVDEAVALQEAAGLDVVTDGEYRRDNFYSLVFDAVDGFEPLPAADAAGMELTWRGGSGRAAAPSRAVCTGRLRRRRPLVADAFAYLRRRARRAVPKVTLPAPSFLARYWSARLSAHAYATRDAYLADVVAVLREEVADLVAAGATYIQFDAPNYALLVDPDSRARFGDPGHLVPAWAEADNAVLEGFSGVVFGLHMCRGNNAGMWAAAGGYELLAVSSKFGGLCGNLYP
jgi:5-methyltetrahydropteroyltriglutamate--homocysteine methyltransferase